MRQPRRVSRHLTRQPFGTRRAARCPSLRTRQGPLPVPHDTSRHDLVPATPVKPGRRGVPPAPWRPSWPSWSASVRALPRMWRTVPCDASTAYAAALQRGTWSALSVLPSHAGLFVPATSPVATVIAGHLTTASSRWHQRSSYQSPWRDWPQGRFCAPSLPDSPHRRHAAEGDFGRFRPPAGSDGALRLTPLSPTNATTARIIGSVARVPSMSGRPGFAARRTLRPLSTAIGRTSPETPVRPVGCGQ